jgi:hypothetical protein
MVVTAIGDNAGVTETPTTPAQPPAAGTASPVPKPATRRRGRETVGDMVRSLALVLVVVAVLVLLTLRDEPKARITPIDYTATLGEIRAQAAYDVLAPAGLGSGWRATSARATSEGKATSWHLGLVTPAGRYAAVEQSDGSRRTFVDTVAQGSHRAGTVRIGGVAWTRLEGGQPEQRALLRTSGGATTLVAGSGSWPELERLARSLRPG